jgi:hypothetical protein
LVFFLQLSSLENILNFLIFIEKSFSYDDYIFCSKNLFFYLKKKYKFLDKLKFFGIVIFIGFNNYLNYLTAKQFILNNIILNSENEFNFRVIFLLDWFLFSLYEVNYLQTTNILKIYLSYFFFIYKFIFFYFKIIYNFIIINFYAYHLSINFKNT